jgi:hypothetical protein
VELTVDGTQAAATGEGISLVLDGSGRKLAYGRLHVSDADGRTLAAHLEATAAHQITIWICSPVRQVMIPLTVVQATMCSMAVRVIPTPCTFGPSDACSLALLHQLVTRIKYPQSPLDMAIFPIIIGSTDHT